MSLVLGLTVQDKSFGDLCCSDLATKKGCDLKLFGCCYFHLWITLFQEMQFS